MRVLQAISSAGMYGAEAVVLALCRALNHHSPGSAVLAVFHNTAQPNLALHEAALAARVESHLVTANGRVDTATPRALRDLAKRVGADVLHTHGYKADVYGYFASRRTALPLVSTCHNWCDTDLATRAYGWVDRLALRRFDAIAAVSADVKARLVQSGIAGPSVRVVRNGIDVLPFQRAERAGRVPLTVGYAGRLSPEKGIDLFVDVAAAVLREAPETNFLIAGDGPERNAVEHKLKQSNLEGHVRLLGRRDDMPHVYSQMDVLLSPSRTEGLPIGLMEAMASGLPVVATAVGDVPALIEHNRTGLLVQPGDVSAMAAATLRALHSEELRTTLGQSGRENVFHNFSDKKMMEVYLELYRDALRAKGGNHVADRGAAR